MISGNPKGNVVSSAKLGFLGLGFCGSRLPASIATPAAQSGCTNALFDHADATEHHQGARGSATLCGPTRLGSDGDQADEWHHRREAGRP
eukprot:s1732_g8.t1